MKKRNIVIISVLLMVIVVIISGYFHIFNKLYKFHEKNMRISELDEESLYMKQLIDEEERNTEGDSEDNSQDKEKQEDLIEEKQEAIDPYLKMINDSDRINVLCLGYAKGLTDTIIVASFEPDKKRLELISIPRDTYLPRDGYDEGWEKKINASYIGKNSSERAQSVMDAVRDVLHIPIHHFVRVDYEGVEKIVDTIGGVEVHIPFDMDYDDSYDDLYIHFTKGDYLLDGEDSVKFLRFRKNNDNSHSDGDIGRIARQQDFMNKAINKSLGLEILKIVDVAQKYVRTSMTPDEMIYYANKLRKIDEDNIKSYTLPGIPEYLDGVSYYFGDKEEIKQIITNIYQE